MSEKEYRQVVLEAADSMIEAFAKHVRENYFACFYNNATFLFHNMNRLLKSRAEYEKEWRLWEDQHGFQVLSCRSSDRNLQMLGELAVFTHSVLTDVNFDEARVTNNERETIVFKRNDSGRWLGVHEHLSCLPV